MSSLFEQCVYGAWAAVPSLCFGFIKEKETRERETDIKAEDDDKPLIS